MTWLKQNRGVRSGAQLLDQMGQTPDMVVVYSEHQIRVEFVFGLHGHVLVKRTPRIHPNSELDELPLETKLTERPTSLWKKDGAQQRLNGRGRAQGAGAPPLLNLGPSFGRFGALKERRSVRVEEMPGTVIWQGVMCKCALYPLL